MLCLSQSKHEINIVQWTTQIEDPECDKSDRIRIKNFCMNLLIFNAAWFFLTLYCLAVCQPAVLVGRTRSSTNNCTKVAWFIIMTDDDLSVYIFLGVRSHWSEFLLKFKRNTGNILDPDFKFLIALIFFLLDAKQTRAEWWHCQQCDTALHCCCSANFMLQQA